MTTELEKQFFDTFGISTITTKGCYDFYTIEQGIDIWEEHCREYLKNNKKKCSGCPKNKSVQSYPQITDRILLELICILVRLHLDKFKPYEIYGYNLEALKTQVLQGCISYQLSERLQQQVQALFKE